MPKWLSDAVLEAARETLRTAGTASLVWAGQTAQVCPDCTCSPSLACPAVPALHARGRGLPELSGGQLPEGGARPQQVVDRRGGGRGPLRAGDGLLRWGLVRLGASPGGAWPIRSRSPQVA
ncbi:unnamed protein product [Prorocentrum cordatum]|uniref:Uncharacterized protein n=1 Tax=Prorocentrum cordatum TaxID=2364126 RepID=A0ABN9WPZ2_9DINO|nr:unnamed protein product [Polarella glacialis]